MNNPYNIYFDMQRNSFYRIDKSTGTTAHTYFNGQNIPYFKPNITGFQPHRRKNIVENDYFPRKQSPKRMKILPQSKKLVKLNFNTLQNQKSTINQQKKYQTLNSERKIHQLSFQPNSTKYLHSTIKDRKLQTQFIEKIKKFQQITSNKSKDNHSPRKDQITGSVDKKDILDQLCITKSNFKKQLNWSFKQLESPEHKTETNRKSINHNRTLSNQYTTQNQLKNERNTQFFIIKSIKQRSQQKSLERDKFRRQNLKKLQKNMLIHNSKGQHKIFGSDEN